MQLECLLAYKPTGSSTRAATNTLVDSYHTGWKGLTFTHYCHPLYKTVEHCLLQHSLVITEPKSCSQAERHLDGKFKHYAHGNGRVDVIPAFLSHWTNWDREVELPATFVL